MALDNIKKSSLENPQPGNPERRYFLKKSAGLSFGFALAGLMGCEDDVLSAQAAKINNESYLPNIWVRIATDGRIRIFSVADELGQGSMTALPLIFAEELDAEWDDVDIEFTPANEELYGNPKFHGAMYTVSSISVTGYYDLLRLAGAQARHMLLDNVAAKWGVPVDELVTEPSKVIHRKSNQRIAYGEIARFATLPDILPDVKEEELKRPEDFRLIGQSVPRRDIPDKVTGVSAYAINESPEGLVYAVAVRSPVHGSRPVKVDDTAVRNINGILEVITREHSVCIVADNYYSALQGRRSLKIEWSRVGEVNKFDSDKALQEHVALAADTKIKGVTLGENAVASSEIESNTPEFVAQYQSDYVYHAQIEPLNATVWVKDGGGQVEAWVGTQAPVVTKRAIASATGISADKITLHRSMVGGGFGRRSLQEMDYVDDAAWLSMHLDKPVKVIWTREDDVTRGWFKPMSAHLLRASIDGNGKIFSWKHRVAVQEPLATAEPIIYEQIGQEPVVSMPGTEHHTYSFPRQEIEHLDVQPGIRTYTVLGVGWTPNIFAVENFMDELAASLGVDAVEFRLRHLDKSERARKVLLKVADMAGWGRNPGAGRIGSGIC